LNISNKISLSPVWRLYINTSVHWRNFNKHQILAKFYVSNASSIGNQHAAFVRSPQNVRCRSSSTVCLILTVSTACWEISR